VSKVDPREALAHEAWRSIGEIWFSDENHDRFHDACEAIDVSPPQLKALLSLEPGRGQPMRDLAANWRCDASWVTGIVDGLEERGYVERRVHPTDRRVKVVELTTLGAKAKGKALDRLYEPPLDLHERLERAHLTRVQLGVSPGRDPGITEHVHRPVQRGPRLFRQLGLPGHRASLAWVIQ
jgi:DNA-binding MarR family transcriptional regulator